MSTPIITIFVRHTPGCKWEGEEFHKGCTCRKHFRWSHDGKQYRKQAGTRSWAEAEELKRRLEDQLAGRAPVIDTKGHSIRGAVDAFIQDKEVQGISADALGKYRLELGRFVAWGESRGLFMLDYLTVPDMTDFKSTWADLYPSTNTRAIVQKRLRVFLKFCYHAGWLIRVPKMTPIKIDEPPTMPLTEKEYTQLLEAAPLEFPEEAAKYRALIQLMRWSGLAVRDASTLKSGELLFSSKKIYHIVTKRQKTGVHVMCPIPTEVAEEILKVKNGNPVYFFWNRKDGDAKHEAHNMSRNIARIFRRAKIRTDGHMVSHRLRDTFAVDLLEKGVPLEEVSKLLGHESIKTTEQHYAKWVKGRQDRLDNLVTGTWKKSPEGKK